MANEIITTNIEEIEAPTISAENSAISAILSGDIESSFRVLTGRGEFTARESYLLTRPDDDSAISIGKNAKNAEIEIDKFLIYSFENNGEKVGIVIIGKDGNKYVTTSAYFIKEFLLLATLYEKDGEQLNKIKVVYKISKNKTADGQTMTYPMPVGM